MKIIELKFKNLNSLYGEWHIDFTDPEYTSNGIFALTGPTGSGKSTILDALCLALYGRTPRLGAVTAGGNEIMSRQTGECFSEVVFESQKGSYRCSWEQHRAHRKPEGKLADSKHEISDAITGKIVENRKSFTGSVIEEKTGMDYERFTRSILLAQGGFDTFLKADRNQKSKILEQITGTDIYSNISVKVHEKNKEEGDKLKLLKGISGEINILGTEELESLENIFNEKKEMEKHISAEIEKSGKTLERINKAEDLENEIIKYRKNLEIIEKKKKDFKNDKIRLEKAYKASVFDGDYASLKSRRDIDNENKKNLKEKTEMIPAAEFLLETETANFRESEAVLEKLNKEGRKLSDILIKVRLFDQKIEGSRQRLESIKNESEKLKNNIKDKEREKEEYRINLGSIKEKLKTAEEYLAKNSKDNELESSLKGLEEKINTALIKHNEIEKSYSEKDEISDNILKINNKYVSAENKLKENSEKLSEIEKHIIENEKNLEEILDGRNLKEYRKEREHLLKQKNLVEIIIKLEREREKLEDGKPCPLCGSVKHPYAEGNIPEKDDIEKKIDFFENIVKRAEKQGEIIKKYEGEKTEAVKNLAESEKNAAVLTAEKNLLKRN